MEKVSTKYNIVPRVIKKQSSMPMLQLINVVLSVVNRAALYNYNGMLLWDPYPDSMYRKWWFRVRKMEQHAIIQYAAMLLCKLNSAKYYYVVLWHAALF